MYEQNTLPRRALMQCRRILRECGMDDAQDAARILVCHVINADMNGLLSAEIPLTAQQLSTLSELIVRVLKNEPVQYAVGYAHFMGLRFFVTPDVLIPRFDTETLVHWAVQHAPAGAAVLDVCTGSGCIAIALKVLRSDLGVCACDISEGALAVAKKNAVMNGADIDFACGDLCSPYKDEKFDLILSNPPYIAREELGVLPPHVRNYEPRLALDGGEDGLAVYKRLIPEAAKCLNLGGLLLVEIGCGQRDAAEALFTEQGFTRLTTYEDMEHRPRVIVGIWEGQK